MIEIHCKNCKRIFYSWKIKKRKFCSQKCDRKYKRKNNLYKKNQKKRKDLIENQLKTFKQLNNIKICYKDMSDKQKKLYHTLHNYIKRYKKKPLLCERCKKNKPIHLANISGRYKKDIKDYLWVCKPCHNQIDGLVNNFKEAYKKIPRNKYGRFGEEKTLGKIKCLKCKKNCEKQNSNQKYCAKCSLKYDIGHYTKKRKLKLMEQIKNDNKRHISIVQ